MEQADITRVVKEVLKQLGVGTSAHITPEYYSINDAAVVAALSSDHIRRAVVGGTLVASDVGTKDHPLYRISRKNLLHWLKEREAGAKPPAKNVLPVSRHFGPSTRKKHDSEDVT